MKDKIRIAVPTLWDILSKLSVRADYRKLLTEYRYPGYGDVLESLSSQDTDYNILFKLAVSIDSFIKSYAYKLRHNLKSIRVEFKEINQTPYILLEVEYE